MKQTAPYGQWDSPISPRMIAGASIRLGLVDLDQEHVAWLEQRPSEGGRTVLLAAKHDGSERRELSPVGINVRTMVHEYGGGAALHRGGIALAVSYADQRIWLLADAADPQGGPRALTPQGDRYADMDLSPDGAWIIAVRESVPAEGEHQNEIVALPVKGGMEGGEVRVMATGHDFFSTPRFSPAGDQICYLAWDHPDMPWDGTELWVAPFFDGQPGAATKIAGGRAESIFQPCWSPRGALTYASDRSGWWNLYQRRDGEERALAPISADIGRPQWVFGMSSFGFSDEFTIIACVTEQAVDRLVRIYLDDGRVAPLETGLSSIEAIRVAGSSVALLGASAQQPEALILLDIETGQQSEIVRSSSLELDPTDIAHPEPLTFQSADGRAAHGFYYPPTSAGFQGPEGQLPPLIVQSHGGPTAHCTAALRISTQFWTSRGFGVVDVNYGGSTGYGRAYRRTLEGAWGIIDLEDCCGAARSLVAQGRVDGDRLAIRGGSAGGYTALCALTFTDVFAAGASFYGVADLEGLTRDTHKFESRYLDRLVGSYPAEISIYRERSPIHHVEQLRTPIIIFQGMEDKVVPPNQAEMMVEALQRREITYAYVTYPNEAHGFRKAETIESSLLSELAFYGHVFGFEAESPEGLEIKFSLDCIS